MLCVFGAVNAVWGTSVETNLGAPRISDYEKFDFLDLNGIPLMGQTLSLDFTFANNGFVASAPGTPQMTVGLVVQTNNTDLSQVLQFVFNLGSGYLVDIDGNALTPATTFTSGGAGLQAPGIGLFEVGFGVSGQLNIYGVHLDIPIPNEPSYQFGPGIPSPFGPGSYLTFSDFVGGVGYDMVPPPVSDTGSTVMLLGAGLAGIGWLRRKIGA
jgi:hypothetical protein